MNNSMISAMVSMSGIQKRLDLLGENIANMDTVGYKRKEATFEDTLMRVKSQTSTMQLPGRATPNGFELGFGSRVTGISNNFTQGSIKETGNPTDFAVEGNALFKVEIPSEGEDIVAAYTRAGDFHLQPDPDDAESMLLVNGQGHYVLNAENERIAVPAGAELKVDKQGNIFTILNGESTAAGRVQLLTPIRQEALTSVDGNLFTLVAGATEEGVLADTATLPPNQQAQVRQGALEASNVNMVDEMAEMLQVQRAYQLAARALTSSETMSGLANNLRG